MSTVIQFDRETGKILKVDEHPDWAERLIKQDWYKDHPEERIEGAGWLTPKPKRNWDGNPENWKVVMDENNCLDLEKLE